MWLYFALCSILFFTILNLVQRKLAIESKNPRAMSMVFNSFAALLAFVIFLFTQGNKPIVLPTAPQAWLVLGLGSLFYALFERGRFVIAKLLDASVLSIVINISAVVAFLGSAFLYGEPITLQKLLGTVLVISAIIFVSYSKKVKVSLSQKGIAMSVLICVFLGLGWMLDKQGALFFSPSIYQISVWTIPLIFIFLPGIPLRDLKHELTMGGWKLFLIATLNVIGYFAQLTALSLGEATRVIPLLQTSTLATVLGGVVLLGEKDHIWRKISAGILALIGVYFLL